MNKTIPLGPTAPAIAALKTEAAANYINTSVSSVEKSRKTGELLGVPAPPYVRISRSVRYLVSDLDAWLTSMPKFKHEAEEFVAKQQAQGGVK